MRATRTVTLGDRAVTVKELTVGDVRALIIAFEAGDSVDPLHALALDECTLADLAAMSDIGAADLEAFTPSELADLVTVCKGLNPHFFKVRAALSGVARLMLQEAEALTSTAPAVPS